MAVPTYDELFNPALMAMHELGGSGSCGEIREVVAENLKLTEADINAIHRGSTTQLNYRLSWSTNYLKRYGLLENSARGVWSLTPKGHNTNTVDPSEVKREVQKRREEVSIEEEVEEGNAPDSKKTWQEKVIEQLVSLSPSSFEKVCQRFLRESGFSKVQVTGRPGDEGVDGTGVMTMNGLLSFNIIFQCKRYTGSVSSGHVRDFRGTMQGRADKGLIITTGTFTKDAKMEASRQGALHIDLIDGEELVEKMKRLGLGVKIEMVESVNVDEEWFEGFIN